MSLPERALERVDRITLGICAMDKKTGSKPMKEIMNRIEKTSIFKVCHLSHGSQISQRLRDVSLQITYFSDKVKFDQPVETWPVVLFPRVLMRVTVPAAHHSLTLRSTPSSPSSRPAFP